MASPSKEGRILKLILENSPLKEWHFGEIVRGANITRVAANKWLKKCVKEGLLKRIKPKGKFPYFTVGNNNLVYYSQKRLYSLEQMHKSGLIPRLLSLQNAKTIILFGSAIRGDWYKDSDIDIFVFGDASNFDKGQYEATLGRHIELQIFQDKHEIQKVKTGLIKNIVNGYVVKGQIQDFVEVA